ncbi:hypothetical protein K5X82_13170 [Halosquirtibacter xylanolyticus]|uniref:hypothetical protein n=1 Tax=Halosquirtibacter xylanolyticus TaxID=3374599 RepID=UPI003749A202|nr:hypothetical protein K5X82_13170 [Prolixibacteraceae bacterium]
MNGIVGLWDLLINKGVELDYAKIEGGGFLTVRSVDDDVGMNDWQNQVCVARKVRSVDDDVGMNDWQNQVCVVRKVR